MTRNGTEVHEWQCPPSDDAPYGPDEQIILPVAEQEPTPFEIPVFSMPEEDELVRAIDLIYVQENDFAPPVTRLQHLSTSVPLRV